MLEFTDMSISDNTTTTHHVIVAAVESSMPMVAQETRDPESEDGRSPWIIATATSIVVSVLICFGVVIWYLRRKERAHSAAAGQDPAGHGAGANGNVELHELPRQRGQQEGHDVAEG